MAYKNIEDSRAAIRKHYYQNKERYLLKNKLRREQIRQHIHKLKAAAACADCNKNYPYYVMDFDHIEAKEYLISKLVNSGNISRLEKELTKCEIVCSNCHRIRTYKRLQLTSLPA
jgi:hypothetical protein